MRGGGGDVIRGQCPSMIFLVHELSGENYLVKDWDTATHQARVPTL
jgi:hypothetical protein